MTKYKLIGKMNPRKRQGPGKWYVTPKSETPLSGKAMMCAATASTTTVPIEMEASLELLVRFIPQQLQQRHTVKIPGLNTFRPIFRDDGMKDINSFWANSMVKNVRIIFTPLKGLRGSVLSDLTFEDGDVLEDDISYASIADYRLAKGVPEDGRNSESPGEI